MQKLILILKGSAKTIGWLLGTLLFSISLYFFNRNKSNDGHKKIDEYISHCENIQLVMNNYKNIDTYVGGSYGKYGRNSFPASQTTFYDSTYKNFFIIELFSFKLHKDIVPSYASEFSLFIIQIKQGERIIALVNKVELADTCYGTLQKPIPIFNFKRSGEGIYSKTFSDISEDTTTAKKDFENLYRGTIGIYLSYIKSKKDFEKMFGKQ